MQRFKNILVATDTRLGNQGIVGESAKLAKECQATLKIVDVVPLLPWNVRLFVSNHEHIHELMIREKQEQLEALAAPLRENGFDVETKVLVGKSSVEIIREVLRAKHDLVVRVAKGADSRRKGFFGTTATRLLRECPCAVHLVAPNSASPVRHVLACVDTSTDEVIDAELNEEIFNLAQAISKREDARFSIVQTWTISGEHLLKERITKQEYVQMKESRQEHSEQMFDKFLRGHGCGINDDFVHMLKGDAPQVIPEFASLNGVDLIVMGTVGRSGAAGLVIGNTAERILDSIECSVIAVKPSCFISPIKMGDYVEAN
ncbi:universal stress protein [Aureliella helgolandensis]|uniref:Universal stress protein E n=1 Tax=Aureliella helgolandensis TaxID=2527968 RepID=A0A518G3A1_9BACT|nr:universal stress protein [Aureliella helgolandensis]QDV23072.1 Universal stress protein E [Aureliella helgolandensis]